MFLLRINIPGIDLIGKFAMGEYKVIEKVEFARVKRGDKFDHIPYLSQIITCNLVL